MRVELPAERIEKEVDSRLKSVGKNVKIKGFRPGKVPAKVVRQRYVITSYSIHYTKLYEAS